MKLHLVFEELYPHPIEKVWGALTDRAALAAWLMENDFEPRGRPPLHAARPAGTGISRMDRLPGDRA